MRLPPEPPPLRDVVALRLVPGIPRVLLARLLDHFGGIVPLLDAPASGLLAWRLSENGLRSLLNARENAAGIDRELEAMERLGAVLLHREHAEYPALLRRAPCPPPLLYRRGPAAPADDQAAVAIVGARSVTQYGRMVARSMGRGLAMAGVVVVSGLAMGIDTEAMLGAAQAGGRTVGVLGCGLGVTYPTSSGQHIPQIIERGALYSEYPTSTQPARHLFPERNTIIAGLSLGVCVVEAREKSGSLLTAEAALDAGRQVFAVPGDITRETSRGANRLIQAGAALVMESGDILRDLEPLLRNVTGSASAHEIPPAQARRRKALSQTLCDAEEDAGEDDPEPLAEAVRTARPMAPPAATQQAPAEGSIEHRIEAVLAVEPTQLNDLRIAPALAEVSQADMAMALLNLELDGRIRQLPGGIYVLNRGD